jgi:hypothetical protein
LICFEHEPYHVFENLPQQVFMSIYRSMSLSILLSNFLSEHLPYHHFLAFTYADFSDQLPWYIIEHSPQQFVPKNFP